jgi:3-hydroxyisobutyrate dehydrogenase
MTQQKSKVALLGLGTMGAGMAANLLKAGFPLTVWNRTAAKAQPLAEKGARVAASPADAAKGAQVIIAMVADDAASRSAWLGENGAGKNGALGAAEKGAVLIESSTLSPAWVAELAEHATQRGLQLIDAPVTGSRVQAEGGQLSFLVGGDDAAVALARPVLEPMAKEVIHLGPVGSGATLKLVNNFLAAVQIASLAEGLTWIERSGLDRDKALTFLKSAAPGSPLVAGISARMTAKNYDVNFLLRLMTKDIRYAEAEAASCDVELNTAMAARRLFEKAIEQGYGEKDMSAVIEPLRNK